jgi:hypothetical protein
MHFTHTTVILTHGLPHQPVFASLKANLNARWVLAEYQALPLMEQQKKVLES